MNNYIILKRFKNQRDCTLAKYTIFNERMYLIKIIINNDKDYSFTKVSLKSIDTEALTLHYKYNLNYIYAYSSIFNYYNIGISAIHLNLLDVDLNPYNVLFTAENDDDAKLRFELDEY